MYDNPYQNAILGLSVALVVGTVVTTLAVEWMHKWAGRKESEAALPSSQLPQRMPSKVILLAGIFERLVFTLLLVCNVSAGGAFIGTWILAKVATGWNRYTRAEIQFIRRAYIGLVGSLLSVFFAVAGAILWHPDMLPD